MAGDAGLDGRVLTELRRTLRGSDDLDSLSELRAELLKRRDALDEKIAQSLRARLSRAGLTTTLKESSGQWESLLHRLMVQGEQQRADVESEDSGEANQPLKSMRSGGAGAVGLQPSGMELAQDKKLPFLENRAGGGVLARTSEMSREKDVAFLVLQSDKVKRLSCAIANVRNVVDYTEMFQQGKASAPRLRSLCKVLNEATDEPFSPSSLTLSSPVHSLYDQVTLFFALDRIRRFALLHAAQDKALLREVQGWYAPIRDTLVALTKWIQLAFENLLPVAQYQPRCLVCAVYCSLALGEEQQWWNEYLEQNSGVRGSEVVPAENRAYNDRTAGSKPQTSSAQESRAAVSSGADADSQAVALTSDVIGMTLRYVEAQFATIKQKFADHRKKYAQMTPKVRERAADALADELLHQLQAVLSNVESAQRWVVVCFPKNLSIGSEISRHYMKLSGLLIAQFLHLEGALTPDATVRLVRFCVNHAEMIRGLFSSNYSFLDQLNDADRAVLAKQYEAYACKSLQDTVKELIKRAVDVDPVTSEYSALISRDEDNERSFLHTCAPEELFSSTDRALHEAATVSHRVSLAEMVDAVNAIIHDYCDGMVAYLRDAHERGGSGHGGSGAEPPNYQNQDNAHVVRRASVFQSGSAGAQGGTPGPLRVGAEQRVLRDDTNDVNFSPRSIESSFRRKIPAIPMGRAAAAPAHHSSADMTGASSGTTAPKSVSVAAYSQFLCAQANDASRCIFLTDELRESLFDSLEEPYHERLDQMQFTMDRFIEIESSALRFIRELLNSDVQVSLRKLFKANSGFGAMMDVIEILEDAFQELRVDLLPHHFKEMVSFQLDRIVEYYLQGIVQIPPESKLSAIIAQIDNDTQSLRKLFTRYIHVRVVSVHLQSLSNLRELLVCVPTLNELLSVFESIHSAHEAFSIASFQKLMQVRGLGAEILQTAVKMASEFVRKQQARNAAAAGGVAGNTHVLREHSLRNVQRSLSRHASTQLKTSGRLTGPSESASALATSVLRLGSSGDAEMGSGISSLHSAGVQLMYRSSEM
ncbi:hypothetical protein FVE85_2763 [Porphyridium purpureum]|uniref:Exocyst complex component Sec6 n=1 Tax=Porphyridium purpureum TaxID=35688 RepID=A0A5J4YUL9_PORPP|nr:hypothetical protein FVE85_2763 [Porphyridium purpureum]|eukprot:POR6569..scf227_4